MICLSQKSKFHLHIIKFIKSVFEETIKIIGNKGSGSIQLKKPNANIGFLAP